MCLCQLFLREVCINKRQNIQKVMMVSTAAVSTQEQDYCIEPFSNKGKFICSAIFIPQDHSIHFTLHPMEDLFIPTSTRLHPRCNYRVKTILSHLSIIDHIFIQLSELKQQPKLQNCRKKIRAPIISTENPVL